MLLCVWACTILSQVMKRAAARLSESIVVVMSVAAADFAMESEPVLSAQQSRGSVQKRG